MGYRVLYLLPHPSSLTKIAIGAVVETPEGEACWVAAEHLPTWEYLGQRSYAAMEAALIMLAQAKRVEPLAADLGPSFVFGRWRNLPESVAPESAERWVRKNVLPRKPDLA